MPLGRTSSKIFANFDSHHFQRAHLFHMNSFLFHLFRRILLSFDCAFYKCHVSLLFRNNQAHSQMRSNTTLEIQLHCATNFNFFKHTRKYGCSWEPGPYCEISVSLVLPYQLLNVFSDLIKGQLLRRTNL